MSAVTEPWPTSMGAVRLNIAMDRTPAERQAFNEGCMTAFFAMHAYMDSLPDGHPAKIELDRVAEQAKLARLPRPRDGQ